MKNITFVIFDTETTGFSPAKDRLVEIGAVKVRNGKKLGEKTWLINPQRYIPWYVQNVHHITPEMIKECPTFDEIYPEFLEFIDGAVLIAHNAPFDIRFIAAEAERAGMPAPKNAVLDSLALFRNWYPELKSHRVADLIDLYDISTEGMHAHRATDDSLFVYYAIQKEMETPQRGAPLLRTAEKRRHRPPLHRRTSRSCAHDSGPPPLDFPGGEVVLRSSPSGSPATPSMPTVSALRANAPGARRASTEPFTLNPAGAPALLLIHGFADGPSVFAKTRPAPRRSRLCRPRPAPVRLRRSPRRHGRHHPRHAGAPISTAKSPAFARKCPGRPVWLVGHSLGGALAYDAALRPANDIAGLVLLAPLVDVSGARSPILPPHQWFRLLDRLLVFSDVVESRLPADLRDPEARAHYTTDKYIHRDIYRALFDAIDAIRSRAADWRGPLLMVVSPSDQIVDSAATKYFFAASNAAPANLSEHHSGGHVLPLDTGNEKIAARIIRFIQAPPAASDSPARGSHP